ncbi:MAG: hypothetical protein CBC35_11255 [Planctomycetes bacterium TMED75]|nr:hypothetical protein [Planctomycetaceae bacterium]OUU90698.1 MAG: hypothetical protein CBC35_11255 [Planctomycetes bacterium TMED75]
MHHPPHAQALKRRGIAFTEVLVLTTVFMLTLCALIPMLGLLRMSSGETTSLAKLSQLGKAHACYAVDWNDRQVTWIPDDFAADGTNSASNYFQDRSCFPPLQLGWAASESGNVVWGYWTGCNTAIGSPGNVDVLKPIMLDDQGTFGSFRIPNSRRFRSYVSSRFYAPQWYAEGDVDYEAASELFDIEGEFASNGGVFYPSSYCLSPAAMLDPGVLRKASEGGYQAPEAYRNYYRSPHVGACSHPPLKTRMIEHNWFRETPDAQPESGDAWQFNHGLAANPCTLFFDGSTSTLSTLQAWQDDLVVRGSSKDQNGLWSRDTPLGATGYRGEYSFDDTIVSHHILTTEGIRGRDILSRSRNGRSRR